MSVVTDPTRAQAEAAFGAAESARSEDRGPSRRGFAVGAAIIALGLAAAVAWFVVGLVGLADAVEDLERVAIPGSGTVTLEEGRAAAYYETDLGEDAPVPPLEIRVDAPRGGPPVEVGAHSGEVSYSFSGHSGQSVAGLEVPRDGRYRVTVDAPAGAAPDAEIAVGEGVGGRLVGAILGAIAIVLVGGVAGTIVLVRTASRNARARRERRPV